MMMLCFGEATAPPEALVPRMQALRDPLFQPNSADSLLASSRSLSALRAHIGSCITRVMRRCPSTPRTLC